MNTKKTIINEARKIFLDQGFKKANIRDIAQQAQVSTGAIYGYFENKEKLYEAAIGPLPSEYYYKYIKSVKKINEKAYSEVIINIKRNHFLGLELFLDYVYADPIAWKLVIKGEGTNYNRHLSKIINYEIEAFNCFLRVLDNLQIEYFKPNKNVIEILIENLINDLIQVIRLDLERDEAITYTNQVSEFFFLGFFKLLKIESKL